MKTTSCSNKETAVDQAIPCTNCGHCAGVCDCTEAAKSSITKRMTDRMG